MAEKCILIIDDNYNAMEGPLGRRFREHGYRIAGTVDPGKALSFIRAEKPDVILLDIFFSGSEDGKPTLEGIKKKYPKEPPVIMISETMHMSRYDAQKYQLADARLPKELFDTKEGISEFVKDMNDIIESAKSSFEFDFVIGNTEYMKEKVVQQINLFAGTDATVLITGDTGTGKEKIARAIHKLSKRSKGPCITLNCGALPDTLIESELFGFEKGAHNTAFRKKLGHIAMAEGGTLFLDEIGDITPAFQVKLLRVLREKEYEPLGGTKALKADVRFITATNKDLLGMVNKQEYRPDLYYRLNALHIHMPPLKERKEDIPLLAKYFADREDSSIKSDLREDVKNLLLSYDWPGNIAELENLIRRAVTLAKRDKILQPTHFPSLVEDKKRRGPSKDMGADDIYKSLPGNPMSLPELAEQFGVPKTLEVVQKYVNTYDRLPNQEDSRKLFGSNKGTVRTWLHGKGLTLGKLKVL